MSNIVAIIGRPNVGKSTLFNRLTESRSAIVNEESGVTRDRKYGKVLWNGVEFSLVDTGGYITNSDDVFESEIHRQVLLAIEECDLVLFVVDVQIGITDLDLAVADLLRRSKKKVFLISNKVDNAALQFEASEFYSLGLGEVYQVSAINGSGTGELLDDLVMALPNEVGEEELDLPRFAIVGRPNAGKSSLVNAFIGEDRNIVTDQAGTTRDAILTRFNKFDYDFYLIDTAGLRKKGKVTDDVEYYSVIRAIRSIETSDVCILMLDATRGVEAQDLNVLSLIRKNNKGLVVCVNKWDLVEKDTHTAKEYEENIRERFAPFSDFPILFISVLTKQRIFKVLEQAMVVYNNRTQRIPTSKLNETMLEIIEEHSPPAVKGKYVRIKYVTQLPTHVPSFVFFANLPQYIKEPYKRFLENQIRKHWDFSGVPINILIRKK